MIIRPETPSDHDTIRQILIAAFANHPYSHQTEHLIVEGLPKAQWRFAERQRIIEANRSESVAELGDFDDKSQSTDAVAADCHFRHFGPRRRQTDQGVHLSRTIQYGRMG